MGSRETLEHAQGLRRASTIPARWYFGEETLALEQDLVFGASWQLAGHVSQLPEPGSYFTASIAGEPLIVVRTETGQIIALSNVCRHRAGPVACDRGTRAAFQCGYHGWVYGLDGSLQAAREMDEAEEFDRDAMALPRFDLALWGPLIFVRIASEGPALADVLEGIDQIVDAEMLETFRFARRKTWEVECNWKVYVDNYLEGYHIPIVHPALNRELDYARYEVETRRWYSIQHAPMKERAQRIRRDAGEDDEVGYFWIWPNLMINVYPNNFSTNLILPAGPGKTLTVFDWYFASPEDEKPEIDETVQFSDEIQIEDIEICEAVQKGLSSRTYSTGRYSPRRENGVYHFHQLLESALREESE